MNLRLIFGHEAWGLQVLSGCIKFTLFKERKNSGVYGGGSVTRVKGTERILIQWYYISVLVKGTQKHTANHQRAKHVIWIVCLFCGVVHPKALCAWIWLVEDTKEAVCSPLTSVLLFVSALWCIEKLWLGYPSQTNAQEIPLLCIILNNSLTSHCKAFIPFKTIFFKLCAYCLSVNCNGVSCLALGDGWWGVGLWAYMLSCCAVRSGRQFSLVKQTGAGWCYFVRFVTILNFTNIIWCCAYCRHRTLKTNKISRYSVFFINIDSHLLSISLFWQVIQVLRKQTTGKIFNCMTSRQIHWWRDITESSRSGSVWALWSKRCCAQGWAINLKCSEALPLE